MLRPLLTPYRLAAPLDRERRCYKLRFQGLGPLSHLQITSREVIAEDPRWANVGVINWRGVMMELEDSALQITLIDATNRDTVLGTAYIRFQGLTNHLYHEAALALPQWATPQTSSAVILGGRRRPLVRTAAHGRLEGQVIT